MSTENLPPFDPDLLFGSGSPESASVRILSYAAEGVPISRSDVQSYQSQLSMAKQQAQSAQVIKPLIGLMSSLDNPLMAGGMDVPGSTTTAVPVHRTYGLSDERMGVASTNIVAGIDKEQISQIMAKLQFDVEPVYRAWATANQQAAETSNYYNYGLNAHLLKEYLEAQIALRIERSKKQSITVTSATDVAGNRSNAFMRPVDSTVGEQRSLSWQVKEPSTSWQALDQNSWAVDASSWQMQTHATTTEPRVGAVSAPAWGMPAASSTAWTVPDDDPWKV